MILSWVANYYNLLRNFEYKNSCPRVTEEDAEGDASKTPGQILAAATPAAAGTRRRSAITARVTCATESVGKWLPLPQPPLEKET